MKSFHRIPLPGLLLIAAITSTHSLHSAAPPERESSVLEFLSIDGRRIPAVLSMPRGAGPYPAVVTIHGGDGDREISYLRTLAVSNDATPTVTALNAQPWAILSGGGSFEAFEAQVVDSREGGASGFMVGRALWAEAARAHGAERDRAITDLVLPRWQRLCTATS